MERVEAAAIPPARVGSWQSPCECTHPVVLSQSPVEAVGDYSITRVQATTRPPATGACARRSKQPHRAYFLEAMRSRHLRGSPADLLSVALAWLRFELPPAGCARPGRSRSQAAASARPGRHRGL